MAQRFGTDVKSSIIQLGKALNDPIANLSALSRAGIQFSDDQKKMIKSLIDSGNQAQAQRVILKELEVQFGGSARAARDTFGGAIKALHNAFGDLLEGKSGLKEAQRSIEELTETLSDPETQKAADELTSRMVGGFTLLTKSIVDVLEFGDRLGEFAAGLQVGFGLEAAKSIKRLNDELADLGDEFDEVGEHYRRNAALVADGGFASLFIKEGDVQLLGIRLNEIAEKYAETEAKILALNTSSTLESGNKNKGGGSASIEPGTDTSGYDEAVKRAEAIIAETTPKIDEIRTKILETIGLFSSGIMDEPQYIQALEMYGNQLAEIENKDLEAFESKIERMEEEFLTESELLTQQRDERLALIDSEIADTVIGDEKLAKLRLKIHKDYNKEVAKMDKLAYLSKISNALSVAQGILNIAASFGSMSFKAQKALAIAESFISTKVAVAKTMASIPYPANIAAAAQVELMGNLNTAAIVASAIGGGSSGSSISAGATAPSFNTSANVSEIGVNSDDEQAIETPGKVVNIHIHGEVHSNDAQRLFDDFREIVNEGDGVLIDFDSRNGQEIAAASGGI